MELGERSTPSTIRWRLYMGYQSITYQLTSSLYVDHEPLQTTATETTNEHATRAPFTCHRTSSDNPRSSCITVVKLVALEQIFNGVTAQKTDEKGAGARRHGGGGHKLPPDLCYPSLSPLAMSPTPSSPYVQFTKSARLAL
ncbi:Aste57867_19075 [Aphanomyces stellatus]|uniref:Aste57867_19075 protein n=1 Tax=Aphanomyces stellatus TaxID=120398 RepID=A0A485LCJ0_9STRA|nr:hypothetical protein As57867_019011 [Aphanomyces stellatus]VFT95800.1 Aste57867_19075 [Aphanomyces stellatus]